MIKSKWKDYFMGTWQLISFEEKQNDDVIYPFGKNPMGYIIYTNDGHVSVQIMSSNRTKFSSDDRFEATPQECVTIFKEYFCYFGTYEIDDKKNIIKHKIEGHIFSNMVDQIFERHFNFVDDILTLTMVNDPNKSLVWKKAIPVNDFVINSVQGTFFNNYNKTVNNQGDDHNSTDTIYPKL